MSEIDFTKHQKDACEGIPEPPPLKEICAPCKPNPDYMAPDWTKMLDKPFFNEKTCEYMVTVSLDAEGLPFAISQDNPFPPENTNTRNALLNGFIQPALVLMLEYYGKLIADQIICANFNGPTLAGKSLEELVRGYDNYETIYESLRDDPLGTIGIYSKPPTVKSSEGVSIKPCQNWSTITKVMSWKETNEDQGLGLFNFGATITEVWAEVPKITNPYALELYAYPREFDLLDGYLKVLVAIPSFIFDAVPNAPTKSDLEQSALETRKEVELKIDKLFGQISRLSAALLVYSKYQSRFYHTQQGFVAFERTFENAEGLELTERRDYYASTYSGKLWDFWNTLFLVSKANDFWMSSTFPAVSRKQAQVIKIIFDSADPEKPYKFKEIKAKQKGCEYVKYTKALKDLKAYFKDQTLMNYIAKIDEIDVALSAKKSYPWLDFLVEFTFPLLSVSYGNLSERAVGDTVGSCIADNIQDSAIELRDYVLDELLSLRDIIAYEYNSKGCSTLGDNSDQPEAKLPGEAPPPDAKDGIFRAKGDRTRDHKRKAEDAAVDETEITKQVAELREKIEKNRSGEVKDRTVMDTFHKKQLLTLKYEQALFPPEERAYNLQGVNAVLDALGIPTNQEMINLKHELKKQKKYLQQENSDTRTEIRKLEGRGWADSSIDRLSDTSGRDIRAKHRQEKKKIRQKGKQAAAENRHPWVLEARKLVIGEIATQDSILTSLLDVSQFQKSGFRGISLNTEHNELVTLSSKLSLCAVQSLSIQAINCLFSGVTEEVAVSRMVRTALEAMEIDVFGFFIKALPPQIQDEVRGKLEKEFKDMPMPWEEGYDSGDIYETNLYPKWLNDTAQTSMQKKDKTRACEDQFLRATAELDPVTHKDVIKEHDDVMKLCLAEVEKINIWKDDPDEEPVPEEVASQPPVDPEPDVDLSSYDNGWTNYINNTANKGRGTKDQAIGVRDLWYKYTSLTIGPDGEVATAPAQMYTPDYSSWSSWWTTSTEYWRDQTKTAGGYGGDATWEGLNVIQTSAFLADEIANIEKVMSDAFDEAVEKEKTANQKELDAKQADRDANPGASALADALAGLSEEELKSTYANLSSGERIPLGGDPDNPGSPGTFGTALGNAQELIQGAYIDYLMDIWDVNELLNVLDRFPGSQVIGAILSDLSCSYQGLFKPPIKSMLSSVALRTCGGFQPGFALPEFLGNPGLADFNKNGKTGLIPNFDSSGKLLGRLRKAFIGKFKDVLIEVMSQLVIKLFQVLDDAICKSINAIGKGTASLFAPDGLDEAMRDAFCPDGDEDDLKNTQNNLFKAAGAGAGVTDDDFDCLYKTLNSTMNYGEYIDLFINNPGQMDPAILRKISDLVNTMCPNFSDTLGTPNDVANIFSGMAKFISPELRQFLRDQQAEAGDEPFYSSICLTQEDYDAWNQDREDLLTENGVDEDTAKKMVDNANKRVEDDLADLAKMLAKSPEGIIGDAINKLLTPPDPICEVDNGSALIFEDEAHAQEKLDLMSGFFKMLEKQFFQDLISRPRAVLNNILRDSNKARLNGHEMRVNMPLLFPNYVNSEEDWMYRKDNESKIITWMMDKDRMKGMFPETVGIWMKNQLEEEKLVYNSTTSERQPLTLSEGVEPNLITTKIGSAIRQRLKEREEYYAELAAPPPPLSMDRIPQLSMTFVDNNDGDGGDPKYGFDLRYHVMRENPPRKVIEIAQTEWQRLKMKELARLGLDKNLEAKDVTINTIEVSGQDDVALAAPYQNFNYDDYSDHFSYQMMIFKSFLEKKVSGPINDVGAFRPAYDEINSTVLNFANEAILNDPNGDTPTGFRYGYDVQQAITFLDLLYVDPDASPTDESTWKYTYNNEDGVMGKSATENPRVHFLDPAIHGGSYKRPKIYIEPATYNGWFGMIKTFIPEVSQCEKKDTGFLDVSGISKRAKDLENSITMDERLSIPKDCRMEPPYDKIASPASHGIMEGIIISTIRVFATELILKTLPIYASVELSDLNVDSIFLDMAMDQLEEELIKKDSRWRTVSGYAYYLLFLEQAVQTVQRQIRDGLIEKTPEITAAYGVINEVQKGFDPSNVEAQFFGSMLLEFGREWRTIATEDVLNLSPEEMKKRTGKWLRTDFKKTLPAKLWAIYNTQETAKLIAKVLIQKEIKGIFEKLNINLRPRPHIQNVHKYLLSRNGILFGSELRSGEMKVENPVFEGESGIAYGNVANVVRDVETENTLSSLTFEVGGNNFSLPPGYTKMMDFVADGVQEAVLEPLGISTNPLEALQGLGFSDLSPSAIREKIQKAKDLLSGFVGEKLKDAVPIGRSGIFYLEKYVRVTEKDGSHQVYNIKEFQEILRNRTDLDPEKKISDYYGDAFIVAGQVMGSIGIQFGVRLIYSPPESFQYEIPEGREQERTYELAETPLKIKFKDSFYERISEFEEFFNTLPVIGKDLSLREFFDSLEVEVPSVRRAIPIVVYENNVLDKKISEIDLDDENMGEDLKCYVDKLVMQEDFKLLFDFCFPIRSYVALYGIYSYYAFFPSIGQDESEIDQDVAQTPFNAFSGDGWRGKVFNKTKDTLWDLFNATYRTDDDVDEERQRRSKDEYAKFLKNILPVGYINLDSSVSWFQQFRIINTNPFDADGRDCKSAFQKLFDSGG